jgi:2-dehydropantoate 2-reductase
VPWWYFHRHPAPLTDHRLASVDPGGLLWERLPPERVIGCVIYAAGEIIRPGVVKASGNEFRLGDPGGRLHGRMAALSAIFGGAGLNAPLSADLRQDVWGKLWGNAAFNPLSVLTGATLDRLAAEPGSRDVARGMMSEMRTIGERLGIRFPVDLDRRIAQAQALGAHKTSMLQDLERGRPLELDAMLGAVVEMATLVGVEAPVCALVLGLTRQRASVAGCDRG